MSRSYISNGCCRLNQSPRRMRHETLVTHPADVAGAVAAVADAEAEPGASACHVWRLAGGSSAAAGSAIASDTGAGSTAAGGDSPAVLFAGGNPAFQLRRVHADPVQQIGPQLKVHPHFAGFAVTG